MTEALLPAEFADLEPWARTWCLASEPERWERTGVRGAARLAASFAAHRERALEMRELATLVRDVPALDAPLERFAWQGASAEDFEALCGHLGWGRIATRVPRWRPDV